MRVLNSAPIVLWISPNTLLITPSLADPGEKTVIEYSDRSLTVLWPRIITAKNVKKNIKSIAIAIPWRNLNQKV